MKENAEIKAEKKAVEAEERKAKEEKKAKEDEINDFMALGEDDGQVYAGGDNAHLEDDFM